MYNSQEIANKIKETAGKHQYFDAFLVMKLVTKEGLISRALLFSICIQSARQDIPAEFSNYFPKLARCGAGSRNIYKILFVSFYKLSAFL